MKKLIIIALLAITTQSGCSDSGRDNLPEHLRERQGLAKPAQKSKTNPVESELSRQRKATRARVRRESLRKDAAEKKAKSDAKLQAYNEYLDHVKKLWEQNPKSTMHTIGKYGLKIPVPVKEEKAEYKSTEDLLAARENTKPPEFYDGAPLARWNSWKAWYDKAFPRTKSSGDDKAYEKAMEENDDWYDEEMAGALSEWDRDIIARVYESNRRKIDHRFDKNLGRVLPDFDY